MVKKVNIYKFSLALMLFLPLAISSSELNLVLCLLFTPIILLDLEFKYSKRVQNVILSLLSIFFVGVFVGVLNQNSSYEYIKDILVFIKPLMFFTIGYYLLKKCKDQYYLFKVIIFIAIIFSFIHFYNILIYFISNNSFQINLIRNFAGRGNYLELLAIAIILTNRNSGFPLLKNKKIAYSILALLLISSFFYFSRTFLIGFFLIFFSIKGYFILSIKKIRYLILTIVVSITSYFVINSLDLDREASGLEGFLYKLKIAPAEVFSADIDKNSDFKDLWDKWRSYEAIKALEQVNNTPLKNGVFVGKGFGALVNLEFEVKLAGEEIQYLPIIHNGYALIIFKTGVLGLLLYLSLLIYLYFFSYRKNSNTKELYINNFISSIAVFYLFTSLIVSGLYNKTDVYMLVLGGLFYLKHFQNKTYEDRNIRN
ncbi:O-antigen ligase family protein [Psychroflexus montanilacus]|uniref:O-antigen ligase family protein n=1 Tax=Psychroflexus montanilacus TaxID=2873598 RepID=UPI001CCF4BC2|nr:O-antigen ligase family protein [Psychroflexus montanilacus]MBZ9652275.1 O-antigen ligase family protein [Psychroflexus montanilacus]